MRPLVLALLLATSLTSKAQTSAERFREAEQQYAAHRPEGMTWDDGTPEAAQALDTMWSAAIKAANDFYLTHPGVGTSHLKTFLETLTPVADPRFGNGLSVSAIKLDEKLYAVAFNSGPAGTVFVFRPHAFAPIAWRIDDASAQGKDTDNLLRAWRNSQADENCGKREPNGLYNTCGPLVSSVGLLPPSSSGAPRFYVDATYSKDAGASFANQLSIWEWEGSAPALLWIGRYVTHTEATRPVRLRGNALTFGSQGEFNSFMACMSCDGRQLLHRLEITPSGVKDHGDTILYPELDKVDMLLTAIAKHQPTQKLASPEVLSALRTDVGRAAARSAKVDPKFFDVGMLEGWSVTRGDAPYENVCVTTDDLGQLNFSYDPTPKTGGFFKSITRSKGGKGCPTKNAIHLPYSEPN